MTKFDTDTFLSEQTEVYVRRHIQEAVEKQFKGTQCIVLLGPRQIGKSTFVKNWAKNQLNTVYRDLEDKVDKLDVGDGYDFFMKHYDKTIILDEIQENPELFQAIKVLIDKQRFDGSQSSKFLLLGSANLDLQKSSAKSLTGRSRRLQMSGIILNEIVEFLPNSILIDATKKDSLYDGKNLRSKHYRKLLNILITSGGLPDSLFAKDIDERDYVLTELLNQYLENDLSTVGLNVDANKLSDCLDFIAKSSGQQYEIGNFTKSIGYKGFEIRDSISALEQLLLIRKLHPLNGLGRFKLELTKHPKLYIRDSGITLSRLGIDDIETLTNSGYLGRVWEGFVVESIVSAALYAGVLKACHFFRTHTGDQELDLVIRLRNRELWGIEIKYSENSQPSLGSITAAETLEVDRKILVHAGLKTTKLNGGFQSLPLIDILNQLRSLRNYKKMANKG